MERLSRIERNSQRTPVLNGKYNDIKIIVPVKTENGIKKTIKDVQIIPGKLEDYKLENLLELGVKLKPVTLANGSEIARTKIIEKVNEIETNILNNEALRNS